MDELIVFWTQTAKKQRDQIFDYWNTRNKSKCTCALNINPLSLFSKQGKNFEKLVLLHPTSPLRPEKHIKEAWKYQETKEIIKHP